MAVVPNDADQGGKEDEEVEFASGGERVGDVEASQDFGTERRVVVFVRELVDRVILVEC